MPSFLKGKASLAEILSLIVSVLAWLIGPIRFSTDWSLLNKIGLPNTLADVIGIVAFGWVAWIIFDFGSSIRARIPALQKLDRRLCGWVVFSLIVTATMLSTRTIDYIRVESQRTLSKHVQTSANQIDFNEEIKVLQLFTTFEKELLQASSDHQLTSSFRFDIQVKADGNCLRALPGYHFGFSDEQTQYLLDRPFYIHRDRNRWTTAVGAFVSGTTMWIQNGFLPPSYNHPFIKYEDGVIPTGSLIACPSVNAGTNRLVLDVSAPYANSFNEMQYDLIEQFVTELSKNKTLLSIIENQTWHISDD